MNVNPGLTTQKASPEARLLRWMNTLCLDVVLGAVLSGISFVQLLEVDVHPFYWVVLAISVWIVYTFDHLVDAQRLKDTANTKRHLFVHRNFRVLLILVMVAGIVDLALVIGYLDRQILLFGLGMALMGGIYFLILHIRGARKTPGLAKEIIVSGIYVLGVAGIPFLKSGFQADRTTWFFLLGFTTLVFADVLLLSIYDADSDRLDQHHTLVQLLGTRSLQRLVGMLCLGCCGVSILLFLELPSLEHGILSAVLLIMAASIFLLLRFEPYFRIQERYRFLAEMVFWLPGLFVLYKLVLTTS